MSLSPPRDGFFVVTGSAGFIGNRLVHLLDEKKFRVVGVDDLELMGQTCPAPAAHIPQWDRKDAFDKLRASGEPLAVFHLGACADTTETRPTVLKTKNLLSSQSWWNYCTSHKIPFYYASSAATYGDGSQGYVDDELELQKLKPLNLYGQSKHDFDLWCQEQQKKGLHPPHWAGFKFFNVYGFGESHKARMASVVFHFYHQILQTGEAKLFESQRPQYEDGAQKRDFIFVDDVLDVLLYAQQNPLKNGLYNLGTGEARSFNDLATAIFKTLHQPVRIKYIPMPQDLEEKYQYFTQASMEKLRQAGYPKPFTSLEEGIASYLSQLAQDDGVALSQSR